MISEQIQKLHKMLPEGTVLVAVSKYRSEDELMEAYRAGQRVFAENRPVEFAHKAAVLPKDIEWHFIGHLQTNKLKLVLPYVHLVQSVDSEHLMDAMEEFCRKNDIQVNILLEMHIAREESKQGFSEKELMELLSKPQAEIHPHLHICGLMGMASHTEDETLVEKDFETLERIFHCVQKSHPELEEFTELSIGMSDDWHIAIKHGATMVRIGSAIFSE